MARAGGNQLGVGWLLVAELVGRGDDVVLVTLRRLLGAVDVSAAIKECLALVLLAVVRRLADDCTGVGAWLVLLLPFRLRAPRLTAVRTDIAAV